MSELDVFEGRIAGAVRSLADQADTSVDAVEVAARAVGRRAARPAWAGWLASSPAGILIAAGLLVAALVGAAAVVGSLVSRSNLVPPTAPAPVVSPTPVPTSTPAPSPRPSGYDTKVTGSEAISVVSAGAQDTSGNVTGIAIATIDTTDDPWATGTGTAALSVEAQGTIGLETGIYRLQNDLGAWEGTCAGTTWATGEESDVTCWLTGSGTFAGSTYYLHLRSRGSTADLLGLIYSGSRP